jgi:hypothetical protein
MSPSKRPRVMADDVEREASRYIVYELGDQLWAGAPVYHERRNQWTVPLHARSLPVDVVLGEITLDAHGRVARAPSRRTLQRAVRQHQLATSSPLSRLPFALAPARSTGEKGQESLPLAELPEDPQAIGQEVLANPEMKMAYRYLKRALADPQLRSTVLAALEAWARAAQPGQ